jgi:hypothetical protein
LVVVLEWGAREALRIAEHEAGLLSRDGSRGWRLVLVGDSEGMRVHLVSEIPRAPVEGIEVVDTQLHRLALQ